MYLLPSFWLFWLLGAKLNTQSKNKINNGNLKIKIESTGNQERISKNILLIYYSERILNSKIHCFYDLFYCYAVLQYHLETGSKTWVHGIWNGDVSVKGKGKNCKS